MALNFLVDSFNTLPKVTSYHVNQNKMIKSEESQSSLLSYYQLKLTLRMFLAGHTVDMVTKFATKMITMFSSLI